MVDSFPIDLVMDSYLYFIQVIHDVDFGQVEGVEAIQHLGVSSLKEDLSMGISIQPHRRGLPVVAPNSCPIF